MAAKRTKAAFKWSVVWSDKDGSTSIGLPTVAVFPRGKGKAHLFLAGSSEIHRTFNDGKRWEKPSYFPRRGKLFFEDVWSRDNEIYAAATYGEVYVSLDGGKTWTARSLETKKHFYGVAGEPNGKRTYVVGENGLVSLSENAGKTWKRLATKSKSTFNHVWVDPKSGRVVVSGHEDLLWAEAGGAQWNPAKCPPELRDGIAHLWPTDGGLFVISTKGALGKSTDLGESFELVGRGPSASVQKVAGDASGRFILVDGRNKDKRGCWISTDGGKKWSAESFHRSDSIRGMAFGPDGSLWVTVVDGAGMYKRWDVLVRGRP